MRANEFKWASEGGDVDTVYRGLADDVDVNDQWDGLPPLLAAVKSN